MMYIADCKIALLKFVIIHSRIVMIRFYLNLFKNTVEQIKIYEQYIVDNQLQSEHQILLYCIKTLLKIISENDKNKIYDFADTIHNIPEIYLGKRVFSSFSFEITDFCDKYGKEYFAEISESSNS